MPAKNTAHYLPECLDSIIKQSYSNWELLVVNDHSSDETATVLKAYSEKDSRIKPFDNRGKGIIEALRLAYSQSSGSYITRMDSDDKMTPQKLALMLQQLQQKGKGFLAVGWVEYFSATGMGEGYLKYQDWLNGLTKKESNFTEIYKECVIPSPCWMVHKSDLDACGGFASDTYPEDYDLCFRFYQMGLKVIACDKVLHLWRDYPTRSSRTDEHYSDNRFLNLKIHYFLKLDHQKDKQLILWGAGKKGKFIAKNLLENQVQDFLWLCNNEKKIGKDIYGVKLQSQETIQNQTSFQLIVSIAMREEQNKIKNHLNAKDLQQGKDYFFFC